MANKILLVGLDRYEEAVADAALSPGHLLGFTAAGKAKKHDAAGAVCVPSFALENSLSGKTVADAYAAGDTVRYHVPAPGDRLQARLLHGYNYAAGDVLISAGDGSLKKAPAAVQHVHIPVDALTANSDLASTIVWVPPEAVVLTAAAFIAVSNAIGTINDANTSVFALADGADNAILSKTFNTATQPTAPGVNDLGTPSATHGVLAANEAVKLAITNGTSAATPAGYLRLSYVPAEAFARAFALAVVATAQDLSAAAAHTLGVVRAL